MRARRLTLALALLIVLSAQQAAGQGEIGKTYPLLGNNGKHIAIWRSESAADSGGALLRAGQPDLAARYMVCVVPPGTRVILMPMPYAHWTDNTRRVTVLDGKFRGCEGSVYSWDIYGNLKEREAGWKQMREDSKRLEAETKAIQECSKAHMAAIDVASKNREDLLPIFRDFNRNCMTERGFPPTASPRP